MDEREEQNEIWQYRFGCQRKNIQNGLSDKGMKNRKYLSVMYAIENCFP